MVCLLVVHQRRQSLCLGSQRAIELLAGEREQGLRQVSLILAPQRLRLRELNPKEYVRYQCSCGPIATLRAMRVRELSWHVV